jgi:hypothetical protein
MIIELSRVNTEARVQSQATPREKRVRQNVLGQLSFPVVGFRFFPIVITPPMHHIHTPFI